MMDSNERLFFFLNDLAGQYPVMDGLMIFAAVYLIYLLAAIVLAWLAITFYRNRNYRTVILFGIMLATALTLTFVASPMYPNERPFIEYETVTQLVDHEPGRSFVSNHAAASFALSLGMLILLHKKTGTLMLVLAGLISIARIYTGIHHPVDILGSLVVALAAAGVTLLIDHYWLKRESGNPVAETKPRVRP